MAVALHDISLKLRDMLLRHTNSYLDKSQITFRSPNEMSDKYLVSLFLYQVNENPDLRNTPPTYHRQDNTMQRPPMYLDLHYLISVNDKDPLNAFRIWQQILLVFHQSARFEYHNEPLSIVADNLSLEALQRLWQMMTTQSYKLSMSFLVTPLKIDSTETTPVYPVRSVKTYFGRKLFSTDIKHAEAVRLGEISTELLEIFADHGQILSGQLQTYLFREESPLLAQELEFAGPDFQPLSGTNRQILLRIFQERAIAVPNAILLKKDGNRIKSWVVALDLPSSDPVQGRRYQEMYSIIRAAQDGQQFLQFSYYEDGLIIDLATKHQYRLVADHEQAQVFIVAN